MTWVPLLPLVGRFWRVRGKRQRKRLTKPRRLWLCAICNALSEEELRATTTS